MFEGLETRQMLSITVSALGDLYASGSSAPTEYVELGGWIYFAAADATHGRELWKTDGTAANTQLVKDINTNGTAGSAPTELTVYDDKLYFAANDGTSGVELWTSNGTAAGTVRVKDINTGTNSSAPTELTVSGANLFFAATTATNGTELWMSNGTDAGTTIVKDIRSGSLGSDPTGLTDMDGTLYFAATTSAAGSELWKSGGTSASTMLVKDIYGGAIDSNPEQFTPINGTLYFVADDGTHGQELWKTTGTGSSTVQVKDISTAAQVGSSPFGLVEMNGKVYFLADDGAGDGAGQYGAELWVSDGTDSGTKLVKDIYPGVNGSFPFFLTNANGMLYFQAEDPAHNIELWKSDGTTSGTTLVKDIYAGGGAVQYSDPSAFVSLGGYVFFSAQDASGGYELWRTSGSEASTQRVQDLLPGVNGSMPKNLAALNGKLYFSADNGTTGQEPYVVTVVNNAPTDIALSATSVSENQALGTMVGTLTTTDPDPDNTFTYALVAGDGSTDNSKFKISGNQLQTNVIFNYETPPTSFSIRVHSTDQDGLGVDKVFTINVTNVNEPPTNVALSNATMPEQAAIGTTIGTLSATDPEGLGVSTFVLESGTGGADNAKFTISGNQLKNAAILDYETQSTYSIRVVAKDPAGNGTAQVFQITLTNVNDAPTGITISGGADEHQAVGTVAGTLSTIDPDGGTSFTYALVSGTGSTDNSWFTLSGNQLKTTAVFDYETRSTYAVRVKTTDPGGLSYEQALTVQVNNVNETPSAVSLSGTSISEAVAAGTAVGTLSTTDPDIGNTFTYSLVSGSGSTDNSSFTINGGQLVTSKVLDYESRSVYSVRVRSTDQGGLSVDKTFIINCTNVNETPTDISLSPNSTEEQQPIGTLIGNFSSVDPDLNDTYTYSLVGGTGSGDNALFAISGNSLTNASVLNYHTRSTYSIRVRTTDQSGASYEKAFEIYVTAGPASQTPTTIGLFNSATSTFYLRNTNNTGAADYTFAYGNPNAGWETLVGDWNGDGYEGVGLYAPESSTFYLTSSYAWGYAQYTFGYGEPNAGWIPLVGDWDGNGSYGVGLYNPKTSTFYLTNNLAGGFAEYTFGYGEPNAGWIPIVGDWDGNGSTGVGLYNPHTSTFYLTNNLAGGYAEHTFGYGEANAGWTPIVGDWNGDGADGVGLYAPKSSYFYMTSAFVSGFAQYSFGYGEGDKGWQPVVGDWDANGNDGVGLYAPSSSTFYLTNNLNFGFADYTVGFGSSGTSYTPFVGRWTPKTTSAVAATDTTASSAALNAKAIDQIDLASLVEQELGGLGA
jgi:ELWxxDGT repeat protein